MKTFRIEKNDPNTGRLRLLAHVLGEEGAVISITNGRTVQSIDLSSDDVAALVAALTKKGG